jgi:CelD/BcsL family acetyltransferase involved in cellulose biosynthesis
MTKSSAYKTNMFQVTRATSRKDVEAHVAEWRDACVRSQSSLYLTPEWVTSLWESHYGWRDVEFYFCRREGALAAVFPIVRRRVWKAHVPFEYVELLTNSYGQNHNELLGFPLSRELAQQLLRLVGEEAWDLFAMTSIPDESESLRHLQEAGQDCGLASYVEVGVQSPFLPLAGSWNEYLASRSSNFRSDMRRKWNKCSAAGMRVEEIRDLAGLDSALDAILQIEERSWKQRAGTSIPIQNVAVRFYRSFLAKAAERHWLRLYLGFIEGRPISYDMGVLLNERYYMLKTGFDESFGQLSPGVYMRQHVVKLLFETGVTEHDFLGDADSYKLRWTSLTRRHSHLYLCNRRRLRTRLYLFAKAMRGQRGNSEQGTAEPKHSVEMDDDQVLAR